MQSRPFFYVLEGPDGSGKTTLAQALVRQLEAEGLKVFKAHARYRFKRQGIFAYHTAIIDMAFRSGAQAAVIDRLWPSEIAYGHACRGGTKYPHIGRMMDRAMLGAGLCHVLCQTDLETTVGTVTERAKDELYPDRVRAVYQAYRDLDAGKLGYQPRFKVHYDRARLTPEEGVKLISTVRGPTIVDDSGSMTGNLDSDTCLMGEAVNPKTHRARWPFHEHGNCSLVLAQALDSIRHREEDTFFCNADDARVAAAMLKLNRRADRMPRVVAMGCRAFDAAIIATDGLDIEVVKVDHPQYVRRFKSSKSDEYAEALHETIYADRS